MALDIERFVRLRPYAFHITALANLASLRRTGAIEPAAALMRFAGRSDLLRWRRAAPVTLQHDGETAVLNDQAPLIEEQIALYRGWSFGDFVEYLNEHVYFWPGTSDGPIKSGLRTSGEFDGTRSLAIRIPTGDLLDFNPEAVPLFCAFNSSAAQQEGRRVRRGPHLFSDAADFPRRESEVVELAFRSRVVLPPTAAHYRPEAWVALHPN